MKRFVLFMSLVLLASVLFTSCSGTGNPLSASTDGSDITVSINLPAVPYTEVSLVIMNGEFTSANTPAQDWNKHMEQVRQMAQLPLDGDGKANASFSVGDGKYTVIVSDGSKYYTAVVGK